MLCLHAKRAVIVAYLRGGFLRAGLGGAAADKARSIHRNGPGNIVFWRMMQAAAADHKLSCQSFVMMSFDLIMDSPPGR